MEGYPYVRIWGYIMGSKHDFIKDEIDRARTEGAPPLAIFKRDTGRWATLDSIESVTTLQAMFNRAEPIHRQAITERISTLTDRRKTAKAT